jgi:molybdopterin converting factor subunit 1
MIVRVKLFAAAKQAAGADEIEVELPDPATVSALRIALASRFPQLAPLLRAALFAVDAEYGTDATRLASDSEIACIPPVSGG